MTSDADKMICCIYREYLQRRKLGNSKNDSRFFRPEYFENDPVLSEWHPDDRSDACSELCKLGYIDMHLSRLVVLNNEGISYMENRFKNGIKELAEFISNFIP